MGLFERIQEKCNERHVSIARLEKECGLGNATVRGWKFGYPSIKTIQKVAKYFDCTVDELLKEDSA